MISVFSRLIVEFISRFRRGDDFGAGDADVMSSVFLIFWYGGLRSLRDLVGILVSIMLFFRGFRDLCENLCSKLCLYHGFRSAPLVINVSLAISI